MPPRPLFALALVLVLTVLSAASADAQVRERRSTDFKALVASATSAYDAGDYGAAISHLRDAMAAAAVKQRDRIIAAMPAAPAGFVREEAEEIDINQFVAAGFGSAVTQEYHAGSGSGRIRINVTANSPMVGMMSAAFGMAQMDPELEVVTYEGDRALFRATGDGMELQLPLHDKHFVEISASGLGEDAFFAMFDQAFVDRLAAALGR